MLDGRVLVIGGGDARGWRPPLGFNPDGEKPSAIAQTAERASPEGMLPMLSPLSSVEIFDPAAREWSGAASMSSPRRSFAALLLPDGRVLVMGGEGASTLAEIYDPVADQWDPIPFTLAGEWPTRVAVVGVGDGKVLVVAGGSSETYLLDLATREWRMGPRRAGRSDAPVVARLGTETVVLGSIDGRRSEVYRGDHWETLDAPLETPRDYAEGARLGDGSFVVVGGISRVPEWGPLMVASAERYDPGQQRVFPAGRLWHPVVGHAVVTLSDGRIMVMGGRHSRSDYLSDVLVFSGECRP